MTLQTEGTCRDVGICNRHQGTAMSNTGGEGTSLETLLPLCWPQGHWGGPKAARLLWREGLPHLGLSGP